MRAKVASRANGHVFEERFTQLTDIQLMIAYRQALKEEEQEWDDKNTLNKHWAEKLDDLFEVLYIFVDAKRYNLVQQMKELEDHRAEVTPEEFPEVWDQLMQSLPEEIIVDEPDVDPLAGLPRISKEDEEFLVGIKRYQMPAREEGEQ